MAFLTRPVLRLRNVALRFLPAGIVWISILRRPDAQQSAGRIGADDARAGPTHWRSRVRQCLADDD